MLKDKLKRYTYYEYDDVVAASPDIVAEWLSVVRDLEEVGEDTIIRLKYYIEVFEEYVGYANEGDYESIPGDLVEYCTSDTYEAIYNFFINEFGTVNILLLSW